MIIRDQNKPDLKGSVLRGFNNTPESIRDQIEASKNMMKKWDKPADTPSQKPAAPEMFDAKKQREMQVRINNLNK